ncbi:MAG TPA: MoaD/ThiS family protein [Ornithinicoccus sp.]|jgi:molybdopterin converting factor small subunit|nr:MoaD/ThiS family protein [Ornithinicoccus sp.]
MATVRYFAAAAEAAGTVEEQVPATDLGGLLDHLVQAHGAELERVLRRSSVLHEGEYVTDRDLVLRHDSVVDVLPPFAGG